MRAVSDTYPARETGFSWHENHDDTISIGFADTRRTTSDGRACSGSGSGDSWKTPAGRARSGTSAASGAANRPRRELYYSEIDGRIHLFGAEEGWIQIGRLRGLGPIGEMRMYDTDGNGYFDRWEI